MSAILLLSALLIALSFLAYRFLPSGNRIHEMLHLPAYWWQLSRVDTSQMQEEQIAYGPHFRQYFLFIPPSGAGQKIPDKLVVYFHGGAWKFGRPEMFKGSAVAFHEAGYPVILPSLRRIPRYDYYDLRKDLNELLRAILQLQAEKGWAGQKIVPAGMSSGANLAALWCFDRRALASIGHDQSIFAGLLVLGGPLALEKMQHSLLLQAFAGKRRSQKFRLADPIMHLSGSRPLPVFCVHGHCDGLVEIESAIAFVQAYEALFPDKMHFVFSERGTHLEAAAWHHPDIDLKEEILMWLKKL